MILNTTPTLQIKQNITVEYESAVITFRNSKCEELKKENPTNQNGVFYVDFSQTDLDKLGFGTIDFEIQYFYDNNTRSNIEIDGRFYIYNSFSDGKVTGTGGIDGDKIYSAQATTDTVYFGGGTTFVPVPSADGSTLTLSWTNDGDLENPTPVSITAPSGGDGTDGTTFVPVPTVDGTTMTIAWENDDGKENPPTVSVTAPAGADGLTTSITLNGVTTEQVNGVIDLGNVTVPSDLDDYATTAYVNGLIGNIDTALDTINGEVIE